MPEYDCVHQFFPNLHLASPASEPDTQYNCIAWAADDNTQLWEPYFGYWPKNAKRDYSLEACIAAFESLGYVICGEPGLDSGFEKIVIWSRGNEYTHAAKQQKNGRWVSKLGDYEDIEHELSDLDSAHPEGYGDIACYMKREKKTK